MQQASEFFGGRELALLYIARRLKDALRLEAALTGAGLDYLVEADRYRGGFIFQSERVGAFFYVALEDEQRARAVVREQGWQPYQPLGE